MLWYLGLDLEKTILKKNKKNYCALEFNDK